MTDNFLAEDRSGLSNVCRMATSNPLRSGRLSAAASRVTVTDLEECLVTASTVLKGTPYSLPPEADESLEEMRVRLRRVRKGLQDALAEAGRIGLVREMDRAHAYWTVFESNSIEFEGPDLSGTVDAIESSAGQKVLRDLNVTLLPEVLRQDKRAFAAIGLETARLLGMRYIGNGNAGMSQMDLRALHSVIMAGSWFAGDYRKFAAGIEEAEHVPFPTYEIDYAMQQFADWTRRPGEDDDSVLRAAVGHAWFAHVHPFQDGNGRVARLLTNVLLGQEGLPPAIVKAKSQRARYIAALAHSDEGGDIMPLTGLFLETIERYVAELRDPRTFKRLFDQLVARRGDNYFDWYVNCASEFYNRFASELELVGLRVWSLDELTSDVFQQIRTGRRQNVIASVVVDDRRKQEIALYYRQPSAAARLAVQRDELVPALAFALPNQPWQLNPYRRTSRADLDGLSEIWTQPDRPTKVFMSDADGLRSLGVNEAAAAVAERLRAGFARHFRTPDNYFGSARWLPKINGGPG
ncbi:Fic family protein [Aeromicrobium sp. 179-A 4D2 NHS]|uniref:Fic family protein n=1 Tax=Aeromicrobium sp. 179-A 4D2 NHS TaxID=3142375 RepID=UPI0039A221BC